MAIQKNILILIGLISLAYVIVFLLSPKDITDYTVADTEYWRETGNRLLLKTAYEYNDKELIKEFPKNIGDWKSIDYTYPEWLYEKLGAEVVLSRAYTRDNGDLLWMDIINSRTGESFHKQNICVEGQGWIINNDSIAEFSIANSPNPFIKLYANRLDMSKVEKGKEKKQVMVYWFMFKKFGSTDAVTMIRLSGPAKNNNTELTFIAMKDFIENQLFRTMYNVNEKEKITMAEDIFREYGNGGVFAIIMMLLIPIGVIITGIRRKD